jgi:hypothetical protein
MSTVMSALDRTIEILIPHYEPLTAENRSPEHIPLERDKSKYREFDSDPVTLSR